MESRDLRWSRSTLTVIVGGIVYALASAGAAYKWGRSTTYAAGSPAASVDARAHAIAFTPSELVVTQVDGWKVQRWRLGGTSSSNTPRVFDLSTLTDRAPRAPQNQPRSDYLDDARNYKSPNKSRIQLAIQSPMQQTAPAGLGKSKSEPVSQASPPDPAVAIGPDGETAAWIVGRELFVSALDSNDEPFSARLRGAGCLPELGAAALVVACRDGRVEIREIRGRIRGEIQRDGPWSLIPDRGRVLALTGTELFEIDSAGAPYTRVIVDVGKSVHALARSGDDEAEVAIASSDGKVTLRRSGGRSVELEAPGVADALAFLRPAGLLAGGSFRGIYLLKAGERPQLFLPDAVGVRALVARGERVAYATADSVRLASVVATRSFTWIGTLLLGVAAFFLLGTLGAVFTTLRPKPQAAKTWTGDGAPLDLPLPDPPQGLIDACAKGDCVLYAGAGLSAQAGYPTWQPFVEHLLAKSREGGKLEPGFADSLQAALRGGQVDPVADAIVGAVGRDEVMKRLVETFGREQRLPDAHRLLKRIPLCAALTTNFDTLLERAYPDAGDRVFTPRDAERLIQVLGRRAFFIAKLYGRLSAPETVLLGPAEYAETVARSLTFSQFMEGLFVSRTLFFVGASLEGIESYLSGLTFRGQMTRPHYALVAVTDAGWRAKADLLRRRYAIEVLPYMAGPRFEELSTFLERLANAVAAHETRDGSTATMIHEQGLRRIEMTNIGPFPRLELDLQSDWNVILGDNGVGKSSVLKAIAACFCGKDVEPYAGRLVRAGEPSGTIVLKTAQNDYRMEIKATDYGKASVTVLPTRPLEVEGMLALGFPALRAVSWDRPKSASPEGRQRPTVEDLLPIVKGDPDPRLDRLKQWIVNLDSRINYEKSRNGDDRYERLLARFFDIFNTVTPGMAIKFGRVNPSTREVTVVTADGEVPIEMISQGSVSLMGWIGILMQRLYEIYGEDKHTDPVERYALVLIDEIDAHMHPEWQQTVVSHMSNIFKKVQFIATTHSPLVVGGMKGRQVLRFVRNQDGEAVPVEVTDEMLVGRADQILTSRLFGMKTTLDQLTQDAMKEYKKLLGKSERTAAEEREFQRLNKELKFKIPFAEETAPERQAFALVEAIINDQIAGSVPEARKPLLDKARLLMDEVSATSTRRV